MGWNLGLIAMDFNQFFIFPLVVALLAGLVIYWVQFYRQRGATRQALLAEVNLLIRQCRDYHNYLSQDSHEWLHEGITLTGSPYFAKSSYKVYTSMLPSIHLLSKAEILRTLEFYSHHEDCESLIEVLFGRIRQQEQAGKAVTEDQVAATRRRTLRITNGLQGFLSLAVPVTSLASLPSTFSIESACESGSRSRGASAPVETD